MPRTKFIKSKNLHELSILIKGYQQEAVILNKKSKKTVKSEDKVALWCRRKYIAHTQRSALLAYALLRNKNYSELELSANEEPDIEQIAGFLEAYCENDDIDFCYDNFHFDVMSYEDVVLLWLNKDKDVSKRICEKVYRQFRMNDAIKKSWLARVTLWLFDGFKPSKLVTSIPNNHGPNLGPISLIIDTALREHEPTR